MFDYLIVGAGFAGSVLAERLARMDGASVLLIDRRTHIGGNAHDAYDEAGILVHQYGPHIFHTNSADIFQHLSAFTEWRPYQHRVLASVEGQLLPIPINLDTVNALLGLRLTAEELAGYFAEVAEPREMICNAEDAVVSKVGRRLYNAFFRGYTRKQWGVEPTELDAQVTARIPVRTNRDNRYFTDRYQVMPRRGYHRLFARMLDHPGIKVMLNTSYQEVQQIIPFRTLIWTGPIDEFFEYRFGPLPYRSLEFVHETHDVAQFQTVGTINYPNEYEYTRVTEFKHLTGQRHQQTSIVYEYPTATGDPYYPIPTRANAERYRAYAALAEETPGVHFVGRLATYQYYNMDQVVGQALTLWKRLTRTPALTIR